MPIPQELADKINSDVELGAKPQDIVHSIMNGEKYPDIAERMKEIAELASADRELILDESGEPVGSRPKLRAA